MLTVSRLERHLKAQGTTIYPCGTLKQAGLIQAGHNDVMSAEEVATALLAYTCPTVSGAVEHVRTYGALTCNGKTFIGALTDIIEGTLMDVQAIRVCTTTPWARIDLLCGGCVEFTGENTRPCGIRREVVISGGTVSMLQLRHSQV